MLHHPRPLANGLHTDHPVPGLPFVDDSHIPVDDAEAIEAVGRHPGTHMWGRWDRCRRGQGWVAFTTDPTCHSVAWYVRWHPDRGRSVLLYRDEEASSVYDNWYGPQLLYRSGGYWWDGTTWFRPAQVWDEASEDYFRRPVPAAVSVYAADLLDGSANPARASVLTVAEVDPGAPPTSDWPNDLALWAQKGEHRPLGECVVKLAAPELGPDQLVGVAEMADIGGLAASTLRAYISRGEGDVPDPQAAIGGRSVWSRPVAMEWAEQRRRSPEGVASAVQGGADLPPGKQAIRERFSSRFFSGMWDNPSIRKRWALRWRSPDTVRELADRLSLEVATDLRNMVPVYDIGDTIRGAIMDDWADQRAFQLKRGDDDPGFYGINSWISRLLDWLIDHEPEVAARTIGRTIGEAQQRFEINRQLSEFSIRMAMGKTGAAHDSRREFLDRVLSPKEAAPPASRKDVPAELSASNRTRLPAGTRSRQRKDPLSAKEVPSVEDTSSAQRQHRFEPSTCGKWGTARDAMRTWSTTARFCVIVLVIDAPVLLLLIVKH